MSAIKNSVSFKDNAFFIKIKFILYHFYSNNSSSLNFFILEKQVLDVEDNSEYVSSEI